MFFTNLYKNNVEEYWNVLTHSIGAVFAIIGSIYLISLTNFSNQDLRFPAILIFSISMIMVYISSSLYHYNWDQPYKNVYKTIDHISIYYLIAGTYTPFLLISYPEQAGWRLLLVIWGLAFIGTIFKFFFIGRYNRLSLVFYVTLGWLVLIDYKTFLESTDDTTMYLIAAGGILYSIGVGFYVRTAKFSHTIWHLFVIAGNACHYFAVISIL